MSDQPTAADAIADPINVVQQLDATAIRERIDALERERQALIILLRAALCKRRNDKSDQEGQV